MKIGIISDTHDLLRPEIVEELQGCDCILHGGDISSKKILDELESLNDSITSRLTDVCANLNALNDTLTPTGEYSGKKDVFNGVDEITFFFEYYGENSFAGKHQEGDKMHLALIDVFLKKKGYIEPKDYEMCFRGTKIEMPDLIYSGPLTSEIIEKIQNNDWTQPDCWNFKVKEGVVFKRSTLMKGQRRPSVKVKTKWWLDQLHAKYAPELWKDME